MRRWTYALLLAVSAGLWLTAGSAEPGTASRPAEGAALPCSDLISADAIAAVSAEGEIATSAGRRLKLVDVRLPDAANPARDKALAWLRTLPGSPVQVREAGLPDRWARVPASISLGGSQPIDIGELLVAEGLAMVDAGERDALCRPDLLTIEGRARARRHGLWAASLPIRADASEDLAKAAGAFVVVEGRVVSVGERRDRTYLNFGRDWSRDFNVTIPRRVWARLKERGVSSMSLSGRVIRVRGVIEVRRAPSLDIVALDMLELVEGRPPGRARSGEAR